MRVKVGVFILFWEYNVGVVRSQGLFSINLFPIDVFWGRVFVNIWDTFHYFLVDFCGIFGDCFYIDGNPFRVLKRDKGLLSVEFS